MRTKAEILQAEYGVKTSREASNVYFQDTIQKVGRNTSQTKLQLPYEAPEHPELPSLEEILGAMRETPHDRFHSNVCRIGPLIIKRDVWAALIEEAENLIYLEAHSQVRVPKVYSVFTAVDPEHGPIHYMICEFIEGETLSAEKWMAFSHETRNKILSKLCEQLRLLRATPSPGYYGRVHRQGFGADAALLRGRSAKVSGPYDTYADFFAALYRHCEIGCVRHSGAEADLQPYEVAALSRVHGHLATCTGTQPVYTHVDPALHNIIVRRFHNNEQSTEDWEVTLIDFEHSGWLPAYMQAAAFRSQMALYTRSTGNSNDEELKHILNTVFQSFEEDYTSQAEFFKELWQNYGISFM